MTDINNNNISLFTEDRFEPCRVCGEPSSGWHCGAVTCEACKKFFLRSINGEDSKYKCIRNRDCVIVRTTRTQCQYCRFQKCKEVGMTINENPNNPTVAEIFKGFACRVCKAPSSGVHFGAITCEGCKILNKGFFRRSIKERAPERYRCMENGNCEISAATRNMCRHCRFQRCIQAGMSAQNSRIGRQSNLFKHNIIEWQNRGLTPNSDYILTQRKVKKIKTEMPYIIGQNGYPQYDQMSSVPPSNMQSQQNLMNVNHYGNHQPFDMGPVHTDSLNNGNMKMLDSNSTSMEINSNYSSSYYAWPSNYTFNEFQNNNNDIYNNMTMTNGTVNNANIKNNMIAPQSFSHGSMHQLGHTHQVHASESPQNPPIEDSFDTEVKKLITQIYQSYLTNLYKLQESINSEHFEYLYNLKNAYNQYQYGTMDKQCDPGDFNSYISLSPLVEVVEHLKFYAKKFVGFTQNIPDLNILQTEDKEELVKGSIHSVILLALQRDCKNYNYFNCDQAKLEKYTKVFPTFSKASSYMKFIHEKFEKYKLDPKEYSLFAALLVISTASKYLKDYDNISKIRERIGAALRQYMFARRNEEITCDDILLTLSYFRKFNTILQREITVSYNAIKKSDEHAFDNYLFFPKVFITNQAENIS